MPGNGDFQFDLIAPRVFGLVHGPANPTDALWEGHFDAMMQTMGGDSVNELGYFVITAGGAPTTRQRRYGNRIVRGRKMIRSIVTDSFFVRQLVTGWSWFAPGMTAYAPDEMRAALLNVGVSEADLASAWARVVAMNKNLSPSVPWVPATI